MGDTGPFHLDVFIHDHVLAVVLLVQLVIDGRQILRRERFTLLGAFMHDFLELGEHGLAEHRRAELIGIVGEQIHFLLLVGRFLQQIVHQQRFVRSRGHLCEENCILRVTVFQRSVRIIGVERVTHFMRQREHAVQVVVMVEQHVRMCAIGSPAIRAGTLVLVLIHVDPALVIAFLQRLEIVLAERLQAFLRNFLGFFKSDVQLVFVHQRREQVIHM
ncbi:hypothetical protein D3C73_1193130 [compost metagenome]